MTMNDYIGNRKILDKLQYDDQFFSLMQIYDGVPTSLLQVGIYTEHPVSIFSYREKFEKLLTEAYYAENQWESCPISVYVAFVSDTNLLDIAEDIYYLGFIGSEDEEIDSILDVKPVLDEDNQVMIRFQTNKDGEITKKEIIKE